MVKHSGTRGKNTGRPLRRRRLGAIAVVFCLAMLYAPVPVHAQSGTGSSATQDTAVQGTLRIEQVQAEMPQMRVWAYANEMPDINDAGMTLNGNALETLSVRAIDPAKDATAWTFLVDCSTSTTAAQMEAVRGVLADFGPHMGANDTVSLITFGTEVTTLLRHETDAAALADAALSLAPDQPGTLFFDALAACAELADAGDPLRREVAFVFSDSVDYNLGGYTKAEVDELLAGQGLPVYAFGFDTGTKEQLDNFGAVARQSGGMIAVVDAAGLAAAFTGQLENIQSAVLIEAQAQSNRITAPIQTLVLESGGDTAEVQAALRHWVPDTTAPTVQVRQLTPESIELTFSEPVQGAENTGAYEIVRANGDLAGVSAVAYDEAAGTALLTLSPVPPSGPLRILCPGVRDISMEENAVAGEASLDFAAAETPSAAAPALGQGSSMGIWLLVTLAGVAIIIGIALAMVKKRGGFVVKGGKLHYADAAVVEKELASAPGAQVRFVKAERPVRQITLKVSADGGAARSVQVMIDKTLFVGRGDVCDLVFDDATMSRQHFVIGEENGVFTLTNLSERGGTRLNGLALQNPRTLQPGDVIEAGATKFIFYGVADAQPPQ